MEYSIKSVDRLPNQCGVYIFKGHGEYLYIGKSKNIKARVKAHLESAKTNLKEKVILDKTQTVQFYLTENEFSAVVLEANLIKEHLPKYNVRWKDNKSFLYIKITISEEYPKIFLSRKNEKDNRSLYFGPFASVRKTEKILRILRKIIPFCTQKEISNKPCFYSKIGLCDPCPSQIVKEKNILIKRHLKARYKQNIKLLIKLLQGKIASVLKSLQKRLNEEIKKLNFERAKQLKEQIDELINLKAKNFDLDSNLIEEIKKNPLGELFNLISSYLPINSLNRIEAYDISNTKGELATGSMIVLTKGEFDKKEYRRFKIKNNVNDLKMLEELMTRRFSNKKLPKPDLIIVDGGKPQIRVIKKIMKKKELNVPVIGIAKNPDRLIFDEKRENKANLISLNNGFNLIKLIRDEAHRFANSYHLLLRKKILFHNL